MEDLEGETWSTCDPAAVRLLRQLSLVARADAELVHERIDIGELDGVPRLRAREHRPRREWAPKRAPDERRQSGRVDTAAEQKQVPPLGVELSLERLDQDSAQLARVLGT